MVKFSSGRDNKMFVLFLVILILVPYNIVYYSHILFYRWLTSPLSLKSRKLNSDEKISSLPAKELEKKLALKGLSIEEFNSRLVNGSSLWRILSVDDDADSDDEDTEPNEANG